MIDWINFTPVQAFIGGMLIGGAAAILILFNGRIAGISGILAAFLHKKPDMAGWRILFVIGLIISPLIFRLAAPLPIIEANKNLLLLALAGLLVGLGTRFANGCTSGHGVCGLARLSLRSLVATMTFLSAGFATVFIVRHVLA
jgi:uncharacterized protein